MLVAGDLADLLKQSESGGVESMSAPSQFADSERVVQGQSVRTASRRRVLLNRPSRREAVVVEKQMTRIEKVVD